MKGFSPPSNEEKMSVGQPKTWRSGRTNTKNYWSKKLNLQLKLGQRIFCWPRYCCSFLETNLVFLSFKWKWDKDLYRSGLKVPICAWSTSALTLECVTSGLCKFLISQKEKAGIKKGNLEFGWNTNKGRQVFKINANEETQRQSSKGRGAKRGHRWDSWSS